MDDWKPREPRANILVRILLFPLQLLLTVVLWIVGVWVWVLSMVIIIGIPVAIGGLIFNVVTGGDGDSEPARVELREYVADVLRLYADWNEETARIDAALPDMDTLSEGEAWEALDRLSRDTRRAASEFAGGLAQISPPPEAQALHDDTLTMLRDMDELMSDLLRAIARESWPDAQRVVADYLDMYDRNEELMARWTELQDRALE